MLELAHPPDSLGFALQKANCLIVSLQRVFSPPFVQVPMDLMDFITASIGEESSRELLN
jgi:hypothetical protein